MRLVQLEPRSAMVFVRDLSFRCAVSANVLCALSVISSGDGGAVTTCIQNPSRQAGSSSHWYYRVDYANQRRCWYLKQSQPKPSSSGSPDAGASLKTDDQPKALSWLSSIIGAVT